MKGEKVSTPLDKDGRGPCGLYNTHTVKALPPTLWHLTMFYYGGEPLKKPAPSTDYPTQLLLFPQAEEQSPG